MNFISYPRIKRAVGFANLQKISCYGQVPDGSTLKCEIHHLGLRASWAGTLPAEVVSGVSTSTLQQIPVSVSYQSWWLIPDPVKAVFHLLPARALTGSACHLQLQQWQLNQGRLCPRGQKHPWEMDVPYKMPPQRRGWAIPMWASYLFLCSREWGCLFPRADGTEETKQCVSSMKDNCSFLRLPQPAGTRGCARLLTPPLPCSASGRGFLPILFSPFIKGIVTLKESWAV